MIKQVNKPIEWIHNQMIVGKEDKSLRICLDLRNLNICVKREHFYIPVLEDITSQLSGKYVFTVIDFKEAFWQVPLNEESMLPTTALQEFYVAFVLHQKYYKREPVKHLEILLICI